MALPGPRQEAKLVVCLYKMLTTCLTALILVQENIAINEQNYSMCLLLSVLFLCYLVLLRVFSCTL